MEGETGFVMFSQFELPQGGPGRDPSVWRGRHHLGHLGGVRPSTSRQILYTIGVFRV